MYIEYMQMHTPDATRPRAELLTARRRDAWAGLRGLGELRS